MTNLFVDCVAEGNGEGGFLIETVAGRPAAQLVRCRASGNGGPGFQTVERTLPLEYIRLSIGIDRAHLSDENLLQAVNIASEGQTERTCAQLVEFLGFVGLAETGLSIAQKLMNLIWS
jgi:hypothetical protein